MTALSGALGLGGRSRRLGSAAERARTAVTWRIRNAIRKIATAHPALGRHLENARPDGHLLRLLARQAGRLGAVSQPASRCEAGASRLLGERRAQEVSHDVYGHVATNRSTTSRRGRSSVRDARGVPSRARPESPRALREGPRSSTRATSATRSPPSRRRSAHAPDFVLGHAFRATVLHDVRGAALRRAGPGQRRVGRGPAAARGFARAGAGRRRRARSWWTATGDGACAALDRVLVDHPRDAFAIQAAHLMDFFRGDA